MTIDWTKPVEWVGKSGDVSEVLSVRREDKTYPYVLTTKHGEIHCYEDGRICIDDAGYIRNTTPAIDWTKPLELMDGTPVELADMTESMFGPNNPDKDGYYWVKRPDGYRQCVGDDGVGDIRNRAEPAATPFPATTTDDETLTLRDQFAMAALATCHEANPGLVAESAYEIADAMMQARK